MIYEALGKDACRSHLIYRSRRWTGMVHWPQFVSYDWYIATATSSICGLKAAILWNEPRRSKNSRRWSHFTLLLAMEKPGDLSSRTEVTGTHQRESHLILSRLDGSLKRMICIGEMEKKIQLCNCRMLFYTSSNVAWTKGYGLGPMTSSRSPLYEQKEGLS